MADSPVSAVFVSVEDMRIVCKLIAIPRKSRRFMVKVRPSSITDIGLSEAGFEGHSFVRCGQEIIVYIWEYLDPKNPALLKVICDFLDAEFGNG